MDKIYKDLELEQIPWCLEHPPELLDSLVKDKTLLPCDTVDLGCGAGNYALWLAALDFNLTGLDISVEAIAHAEKQAKIKGLPCSFLVKDILGDISCLSRSFDLAYDWEVLHHIFPDDRRCYVNNVYSLLRPGGKYLSVCFSEDDLGFGGKGKFRMTKLGTKLYFSSENELRELFERDFHICRLSTVETAGKFGSHQSIAVLMERR